MSLENWLQSGYLNVHKATVAEVQKLLALVDRELSDAGVVGLSPDGHFVHAYDAALQLCKLALHASGYEVRKGPGHHAHTINSLEFSLGKEYSATLIYLSKCSTKRHQSIYDHVGVVEEQDAQDLLDTARQLKEGVLNWLRVDHPNLVPQGYEKSEATDDAG